jgi:hypothetical protein
MKRWLASALLVTLVFAACGGDDDDDDSTTSAQFCSDKQALQTSVADLKNVDIVENGTSALTDAVDEVKKNAEALKESASDEFKPDVDALTTAISELADAVKGLTSGGGVSAVETSAGDVQDAWSALETKVKSVCDD